MVYRDVGVITYASRNDTHFICDRFCTRLTETIECETICSIEIKCIN